MMLDYINEKSMVDPQNFYHKRENFPKVCIATWQIGFINIAKKMGAKPIWNYIGGTEQIFYALKVGDKEFGIIQLGLGGPNAAGFIEDSHALGVEQYVFIGSCGVLSEKVGNKLFIIPDKAFRDEGTSWHYLESKDEFIDIPTSSYVQEVMDSLKIPYEKGPTWTTDAIYRETQSAVNIMKAKGCISVEMECASIMAAAKYKNLTACQILFCADKLTGDTHDIGTLHVTGGSIYDIYMKVAIELACRLPSKE